MKSYRVVPATAGSDCLALDTYPSSSHVECPLSETLTSHTSFVVCTAVVPIIVAVEHCSKSHTDIPLHSEWPTFFRPLLSAVTVILSKDLPLIGSFPQCILAGGIVSQIYYHW